MITDEVTTPTLTRDQTFADQDAKPEPHCVPCSAELVSEIPLRRKLCARQVVTGRDGRSKRVSNLILKRLRSRHAFIMPACATGSYILLNPLDSASSGEHHHV